MNSTYHINQNLCICVLTRHSLRLSLVVLRCTSIGDVSFVVIFIYFFRKSIRYKYKTNECVDGFECNSNSSCHSLRERSRIFLFFLFYIPSLFLFSREKKREKNAWKYCCLLLLYFFVITPSVVLNEG
jgi:hypothetical protein